MSNARQSIGLSHPLDHGGLDLLEVFVLVLPRHQLSQDRDVRLPHRELVKNSILRCFSVVYVIVEFQGGLGVIFEVANRRRLLKVIK